MASNVSRRRIAQALVSQLEAGDPASLVMRRAAAYLFDHKRLDEVDLLLKSLYEVLAERGLVLAEITTAQPLDEALKQAIKDYVTKTHQDSAVAINEQVDSSLLGGVVIQTPKRTLDASIASQLKKLRTS